MKISWNPADYLSSEQLKSSKRLQNQYEQLKEWAAEPTEISRQTINRFLCTVQEGLMSERPHGPAHKPHYIDWALGAMDVQLRMFNKEIRRKSRFA